MKKTTILAIVSSGILLLAWSCDKNYHEVVAPDELGILEHEYFIGETGGDLEIPFLANKRGDVILLDEADGSWVQLGATSFDTDGDLKVHLQPNSGFKRRADILLSTDTRKDTVSIFQNGAVEEIFYVSENSMLVYNGTSEVNTVLTDINVPLDRIKMEVRFSGSEEWITDCQLTSSAFSFRTTDNTDKNYTRHANVILTYIDGWRVGQEHTISVIQARADNKVGTVFTPEDLRSAATVGGYTFPEDAIIEGYIVSTAEGGNAGDAQVEDFLQGIGYIDYTLTERTAYLVSVDGQYGFRLITTEAAENGFKRFSRITLNIGGAVIRKSKGEPVQYTIEGVQSRNVLTSADCTMTMPRKEKSITELTDDDINTLVTLKDCEIAMRKGPFTPVNEGYTTLCGYNRLAKYPILIRCVGKGRSYWCTYKCCLP